MRESIFFASIRSFFVVLFGIMGLIIGFFLVVIVIGAMVETSEGEPEITYKYSPEIKPNALGVRKSLSSTAPVILKINFRGILGTEALNRHTIRQQLIESRERSFKDNRVKALLLHIDSPGGTVVDADAIYRAIKDYKETYKVPVFAYVDGLCASGGMYVAASADKIFASDVSIIGSIGVISPSFFNVSQLLDKVGVQSLTLSDGKGKDDLNPLRPWRKGEEDNIKAIIANFYDMFIEIITTNRPELNKAKLIDDYGANIFVATKAKEYGYIDESGYSLNQTLNELAKKIGIEDDYYQVVELESRSWITELFKSEWGLLKGRITHQVALTPDTDPKLLNQYLYLYRP